ncbi:MAG: AAA family ATPase [Gammaproteobacteria bacterium]|nr:AAA family ATPase [Gammaproteobacteria bacterium]
MNTRFNEIRDFLNQIVLGKEKQIELCLCCILAKGHLLIEDLPGMGKTLLAHALAKVLGLEFSRIQFTSDMLPADITGVSVFEASNNSFHFHKGPIFSSVVLADEINRASPKAQSALLEAMEERQVSVDGKTYPLPFPFFVIATQNPLEQTGTFPLPESQLDRFFMRISIGYPDREAERKLLENEERRLVLEKMPSIVTEKEIVAWQQEVKRIKTEPALLDYVQDLIQQSRDSGEFGNGISPRAGLDLINAGRAWALLNDRKYVIPEDIQAVLPSAIGHRLTMIQDQDGQVNIGVNPAQRLLEITPV